MLTHRRLDLPFILVTGLAMNYSYFIPQEVLLLFQNGRIHSKCFLGCSFPSKLEITIIAMKTLTQNQLLLQSWLKKKKKSSYGLGKRPCAVLGRGCVVDTWKNGRPAIEWAWLSRTKWAPSDWLQAGAAQTQGHQRTFPSLQQTIQPMMLAWAEGIWQSVDLLLIIVFSGR